MLYVTRIRRSAMARAKHLLVIEPLEPGLTVECPHVVASLL
jgi:hypothetical protein